MKKEQGSWDAPQGHSLNDSLPFTKPHFLSYLIIHQHINLPMDEPIYEATSSDSECCFGGTKPSTYELLRAIYYADFNRVLEEA